jgi:metabotropic glutamate receptor 2/3
VQDSKVQFVVDAVYAFAHALDAQHRDFCPGHRGLCDKMRVFDGGSFYKDYLLKVNFTGETSASPPFF